MQVSELPIAIELQSSQCLVGYPGIHGERKKIDLDASCV
jgi:hypothetical protein